MRIVATVTEDLTEIQRNGTAQVRGGDTGMKDEDNTLSYRFHPIVTMLNWNWRSKEKHSNLH